MQPTEIVKAHMELTTKILDRIRYTVFSTFAKSEVSLTVDDESFILTHYEIQDDYDSGSHIAAVIDRVPFSVATATDAEWTTICEAERVHRKALKDAEDARLQEHHRSIRRRHYEALKKEFDT